ncbi:MAG: hypothetical protein AABZ84_03295 [Pseudomonadota bacterium]
MTINKLLCVGVLALLMTACGGDDKGGPPAPVGDQATLEKLATSYEALVEKIPGNPWMLPPKERKRFVEQVFSDSGYHYGTTLRQLAQGGWQPQDQSAKDLAELVLMPTANLGPDQTIDGVYSEEELAAVRKLQAMLR